jgi:hypothetical protein
VLTLTDPFRFLSLSSGEQVIRQWVVGKTGGIFLASDVRVAVTTKRAVLFSQSGAVGTTWTVSEFNISDVVGVDFRIGKVSLGRIILGLLLILLGLTLLVDSFSDLNSSWPFLLLALVFVLLGLYLIWLGLQRTFLFGLKVSGYATPFAVGSLPLLSVLNNFVGLPTYVQGRSTVDSVKVAREIGAVIHDIQEFGSSSVDTGDAESSFNSVIGDDSSVWEPSTYSQSGPPAQYPGVSPPPAPPILAPLNYPISSQPLPMRPAAAPPPAICPTCGGPVEYAARSRSFYCQNCRQRVNPA